MPIVQSDDLNSDDPPGANPHKLHERSYWVRNAMGSAELFQNSGKYYQAPGNDGGVQHVLTQAAATVDGEYAEAVIDCKSDVGAMAVGVRVTSDANNGYFFMRFAGAWRLYRLISNAFTLLASTTGSLSTGSHTFRITATGTGASVALACSVDGSALSALDYSDTSGSRITTLGYCGIYSDTAASTTTGLHLDNITLVEPGGSAPVLSSPTTVSTGNTIATVRVTTDTAPTGSSILAVQVLPAADATPTAAAILASPTQTITSGASGARDFNLTGLTNGTAYKAHFAQTGPSNVVSTASFTPSTVPGAPTIGTAVAGNAQATVNGTAPGSTGGSAITGYRSTATPGGSTVTGASLPITHTGLTNGAAYTFTLAAQNANGYGAESAASNSVTPSSGADVTPPTLGGSITIGTVTSSSIQASWSAGSDNVAVTSYEVSSNGGGSYSDVGNVLTYTFTGLAPSTSYALRVRAKDAAGNVSSALSATQSTGAAPSSITGTFTLPGADDRTDKQEVTLHTVQALSSLTVDGNGATVNGAPASLAANGFFRLRFDAQSVAWYRVG